MNFFVFWVIALSALVQVLAASIIRTLKMETENAFETSVTTTTLQAA